MPNPTAEPTAGGGVPDFNTYPIDHHVVSAGLVDHGIELVWTDGARTQHHRFVLRENSADPLTIHPESREQQTQFRDLDPDTAITSVQVEGDGTVVVTWSHGPVATSRYHPGWLRAWAPGMGEPHSLGERTIWTGSFEIGDVTFDGPALLSGGEEFGEFLTALHTHGLGLVKGLELDADMVTKVASMIGPVRATNFGLVFDVQTKSSDVTSNAYTDLELPVHTDLDTREYMPGLQLLWCMRSDATGGESRFSDAAAITAHLRHHEPDAFQALSTIDIAFINKSRDSDYRHTGPFLVVDEAGDLVEARWSPWLRGPLQTTLPQAERFYAGLRCALELAESPEFMVAHKLSAGELVAFDNRRILHGRSSIDRTTGDRWLRGCYVEREELESRLRVLGR